MNFSTTFVYLLSIWIFVDVTSSVPGHWSQWSSWAPCEQADSANKSDQCSCSTRQCNKPAPKNGSAKCEGVSVRVTNCTVHGNWTEWSEWSACSQSCGRAAIKNRRRTCTSPAPAFGGRICLGEDFQRVTCADNPPCPPPTPEHPVCSPWASWSECSARCGDGYQYRTREVKNRTENPPCPEKLVEVQKCHSRPCPTAQKVIEYTDWECSANELEDRYRIVSELHNATFLKVNVHREERNSSETALCTDICGHWSNWSECNKFNVQIRTRKCMTGNNGRRCLCSDEESRSCKKGEEEPTVILAGASAVTLLLACFLSFIVAVGIGGAALFCYCKIKKEHHHIPSRPRQLDYTGWIDRDATLRTSTSSTSLYQ